MIVIASFLFIIINTTLIIVLNRKVTQLKQNENLVTLEELTDKLNKDPSGERN